MNLDIFTHDRSPFLPSSLVLTSHAHEVLERMIADSLVAAEDCWLVMVGKGSNKPTLPNGAEWHVRVAGAEQCCENEALSINPFAWILEAQEDQCALNSLLCNLVTESGFYDRTVCEPRWVQRFIQECLLVVKDQSAASIDAVAGWRDFAHVLRSRSADVVDGRLAIRLDLGGELSGEKIYQTLAPAMDMGNLYCGVPNIGLGVPVFVDIESVDEKYVPFVTAAVLLAVERHIRHSLPRAVYKMVILDEPIYSRFHALITYFARTTRKYGTGLVVSSADPVQITELLSDKFRVFSAEAFPKVIVKPESESAARGYINALGWNRADAELLMKTLGDREHFVCWHEGSSPSRYALS